MKHKLRFYIFVILSAPGVMIHEFSHVVFCLLMNVPIYKVCYFRLGNPAGYVEHQRPKGFIQAFFISVGPFILGSILSVIFFWFGIISIKGLINQATTIPLLPALLSFWFGLSIALNCFPSDGDAKVLLSETNHHVLQRFNPLAIIVYPFILLIKLANYLRKFYFDWIYAIVLLGIAIYITISLIK